MKQTVIYCNCCRTLLLLVMPALSLSLSLFRSTPLTLIALSFALAVSSLFLDWLSFSFGNFKYMLCVVRLFVFVLVNPLCLCVTSLYLSLYP